MRGKSKLCFIHWAGISMQPDTGAGSSRSIRDFHSLLEPRFNGTATEGSKDNLINEQQNTSMIAKVFRHVHDWWHMTEAVCDLMEKGDLYLHSLEQQLQVPRTHHCKVSESVILIVSWLMNAVLDYWSTEFSPIFSSSSWWHWCTWHDAASPRCIFACVHMQKWRLTTVLIIPSILDCKLWTVDILTLSKKSWHCTPTC